MKAVGIIAEYNPLHNGHCFHIEESKKLAGADAVVVAMSGNYVQRGEPAILDKWERAKHAVLNGADVVVEIPVLYCLGNSKQYAEAGVKLLESLGCVSYLAFGSESGNIDRLISVKDNLAKYENEIASSINELTKTHGYSYPKARQLAYQKIIGNDDVDILEGANDNLAISYLSAIKELTPIAIKRVGADYNDVSLNDEFQSASGIRKALFDGESVSEYIPSEVASSLENNIITRPDEWLGCLKYAVMSMDADEIDNCPSGGEGLGNKIKKEISNASSWDDLVTNVKSKRYTYTRISRLCMQIILGIKRDDWNSYKPEYIRILALSKKGRELISHIEKNEINKLPIITNINKQNNCLSNEGAKLLNLESHSTDIYNLVTGRDQSMYQEHRIKPFIQ